MWETKEMIPHGKGPHVYPIKLLEKINLKILEEKEQAMYDILFNNIIKDTGLHQPSDLMLLDIACFDYVRIKRLQELIAKGGDTFSAVTKYGSYDKVRECSYLLNAINASFRASMRELMLSRKERTKKEIGKDTKDFASWLEENTVEADSIEVNKDGKSKNDFGKGKTEVGQTKTK